MRQNKLVIKPKLRGDDGYRVFSIRIKEELVIQIDKIVEETGRSRNELIGTFLKYALDKCVVEKEE